LVVAFVPGLIMLLGFSSMFYGYGYAYGYSAYGGWGLVAIISMIPFVLEALALPGLFKRSKYAWNFLMYASLVAIVENILSFSVGGIIGGIIGLYILFQIKELYTGRKAL
jgi:hypothetical protein